MRAIIAVPFFDTPENGRSGATRRTFATLRGQIEPPHQIVAVDNGSTDKSAYHDVSELADTLVVLDEPHSIAYGVNFAWHLYEDAIMRGEAVAVKHDSDLNVVQSDWLDVLLSLASEHSDLALVGPKHSRIEYGKNWVLKDHDTWFESPFVHGGVAMRTPKGFETIGYAWQPYGRWGWQDHFDCKRIRQFTALKIGIVKGLQFEQHIGHSALSREDKEEIRAKGNENLFAELDRIKSADRPVFQEFTP